MVKSFNRFRDASDEGLVHAGVSDDVSFGQPGGILDKLSRSVIRRRRARPPVVCNSMPPTNDSTAFFMLFVTLSSIVFSAPSPMISWKAAFIFDSAACPRPPIRLQAVATSKRSS